MLEIALLRAHGHLEEAATLSFLTYLLAFGRRGDGLYHAQVVAGDVLVDLEAVVTWKKQILNPL